jgi:hypothetical protein
MVTCPDCPNCPEVGLKVTVAGGFRTRGSELELAKRTLVEVEPLRVTE